MEYVIVFSSGIILGALLVLFLVWLKKREAREIAHELLSQTEYQKIEDLEVLIGKVKDAFGSLSHEALKSSTAEFLKLANETLSRQSQSGEKDLESKKKLIDQTLEAMKGDLKNVQNLVVTLEKDREQKYGELTNQLKSASEQTAHLHETTRQLQEALSSTKMRGQWGERMAEDVLRLAGFVEGINYIKQQALQSTSTRPDYTFFLPQNLKVNMDVKFPLNNYLRYLEAEGERDKETYKTQFLRDARSRIKEVLTRDYINPEEHTVDYVIVFIPNEQVYAFINEHDGTLMDEALKNKVILCSPITLYAILAVIRQAVDNFNLEQTASHILSLLGSFYKQWEAFVNSFEKMGKKIDEAQKEFNTLTTTRRNKLDRQLRQIEDLRMQRGISVAALPEGNGADDDVTGEA